jgi:hypothetical protein
MALTPDELAFLRGVYGLGAADASRDAEITRAVAKVPTDPVFYTTLDDAANKLAIDPAWILIVVASESNFDVGKIPGRWPTFRAPDGSVVDGTPRGLNGFTADNVGTTMTASEWEALPSMTAAQQMVFVYRVLAQNMKTRLGGRPYAKMLEVYISNALPGALRPDGRYGDDDVLYSGVYWLQNAGIDSWPTNFQRVAMLRNEVDELNADMPAYVQKLASMGLLHGKVLMKDLRNYADRMNGADPNGAGWGGNPARWALSWNLALKRYNKIVNAYSDTSASKIPKSEPKYSGVSVSSKRPGYTFDSSLPNGPGPAGSAPLGPIAVPSASPPIMRGFSLPINLTEPSWLFAAAGAGILIAGALVMAHYYRRA